MQVSGATLRSSVMGTYTRIDVKRFDRPVYEHFNQAFNKKEYLFYWEYVPAGTSGWGIGLDYYTLDRMTIRSLPSDASDALDAHLVQAGDWYAYVYSSWQANPAITVVCTSTGMHFAAAGKLVVRKCACVLAVQPLRP